MATPSTAQRDRHTMREACELKWTDIDTENPSIRVTPEKGRNPRILKISAKLTSMLNALPRDSQIFLPRGSDAMRKSYQRQRTTSIQNAKLKNSANHLPHTPALQRNHGIPQNQRHPTRHADPRTQKHQQHPDLHPPSQLQRRRLHGKSRPFRTRSLPAHRSRVRICLRL
jgi:integrase